MILISAYVLILENFPTNEDSTLCDPMCILTIPLCSYDIYQETVEWKASPSFQLCIWALPTLINSSIILEMSPYIYVYTEKYSLDMSFFMDCQWWGMYSLDMTCFMDL